MLMPLSDTQYKTAEYPFTGAAWLCGNARVGGRDTQADMFYLVSIARAHRIRNDSSGAEHAFSTSDYDNQNTQHMPTSMSAY